AAAFRCVWWCAWPRRPNCTRFPYTTLFRSPDGVDPDREREFFELGITGIVPHLCDGDAHAFTDLRRGETRAVVRAHRLDHVLDQVLDRSGRNGRERQFFGALSEGGMTELEQRAHSHG